MTQSSWLTNIRLESGYQYDPSGLVTGTETALCHVRVQGGKIAEIVSADTPIHDDLPKLDVRNRLMLPALKEMHIHIDKTYYGGPWKACTPNPRGIFSRIEEERELLPRLLPTAQLRAEKMLELLLRNGHTHIRTHCNIDPVVGLKNLEATMAAIESYNGKLTAEVVAFPQHGLLRSESVGLVREAMRRGAKLVGGVDPATVDENIEKSLNTMIELAVEANADLDVHLHDPGSLGIFTFKRLAALTREAGWQGRVTISHALALGDIPLDEAAEVAEMLADLGISITSTVPINRPTIPIPLLQEKGVAVSLGNDSITDHWSPFGTGDTLEKASRLAERFRRMDERSLGETLGFITGGVTPLNRSGEQVWPKVGDEANVILVEASCSAEAVARRTKPSAVLYQGQVVAGILD